MKHSHKTFDSQQPPHVSQVDHAMNADAVLLIWSVFPTVCAKRPKHLSFYSHLKHYLLSALSYKTSGSNRVWPHVFGQLQSPSKQQQQQQQQQQNLYGLTSIILKASDPVANNPIQ